MREKLETLSLTTLKDLAKQEGIKGISGLRKAEIIDLLCEQEEKGKQEKETAAPAPASRSRRPKRRKTVFRRPAHKAHVIRKVMNRRTVPRKTVKTAVRRPVPQDNRSQETRIQDNRFP